MQTIMDINNPSATVRCWVDLYSDEMFSWAFYKTNKREVAEDLVQDTFIAAFEAIQKFAGKSDVKTWLFAILNNKIAGYFRKQFRSHQTESGNNSISKAFFDEDGGWLKNERPNEWTTDDPELLDDIEFKNTFRACLENLPPLWNAALNLKFLEEKKGEQICQELGISTTNYWQVLHRAKLQMRKCLENHWFKK
jgi:RNA polymerase sigma-70 factor (TIGR02943 family)